MASVLGAVSRGCADGRPIKRWKRSAEIGFADRTGFQWNIAEMQVLVEVGLLGGR
jgi:hypothetical protein